MTLGFFPAFFDHPPRIRFATQETDEHIELLLRQHFVVNVPWVLTALFLLLIPSIIAVLASSFSPLDLSLIPDNVVIAVTILWYLLVLAYILEHFLFWYFNIYIITNHNLVDINFYNLINRDVVEVGLRDVQSSRSVLKGIFASLFQYGDVIIETAAENQRIEFHKVPQPDFVSDRIMDLRRSLEGPGGGN